MVQNEEAGAPSDAEILRQQECIQSEISADVPLVAPVASLSVLAKRETRPNASRKIEELHDSYQGVYLIRGDGNCFYRSFLLGMFIRFAEDKDLSDKLDSVIRFINDSKQLLTDIGMPDFAIEDFWEEFQNQLSNVKTRGISTDDVIEMFNNPTVSDYLVMYARFLTSWYLQSNSEQYMLSIPDWATMQQFVRSEVEPMGKEADHIHCISLTRCLDIPIKVEYLDNNPRRTSYIFPDEESEPILSLLYRPGHYDLLREKTR